MASGITDALKSAAATGTDAISTLDPAKVVLTPALVEAPAPVELDQREVPPDSSWRRRASGAYN